MSSEPPAGLDVNIARFRDAETVADYTDVNGPRDCEAFLFATYLAPGSDILDLGVGAGRTASVLAPLARTYLGVDYSEEMIAAAKRNFPQYRFSVMDAADLSPLANESFDVIIFSFNGLSYLFPDDKRLACIRECHRVLRRGGILIFSLHNCRSLFVRPARTSRSLAATFTSLLGALRDSGARMCRRLQTKAFWLGHGYIITSSHGDLTTFAASAAYVRSELDAAGFDFVAIYGDAYPNRMSRLFARWNYYVFRKRGALGLKPIAEDPYVVGIDCRDTIA